LISEHLVVLLVPPVGPVRVRPSLRRRADPVPVGLVPRDGRPGHGRRSRVTGVYYDDSYNRVLLPAGTTMCTGVKPGAEVTYFEALDRNPHALDAGQGLPGLPASILGMTGNPTTLIDPGQLPVDPATCQPVYPHSYLR